MVKGKLPAARKISLIGSHLNWVWSEKESHSVMSDFCDPMDYSLPAPLSMEFSRQEYWSGLPFPTAYIEYMYHYSQALTCRALYCWKDLVCSLCCFLTQYSFIWVRTGSWLSGHQEEEESISELVSSQLRVLWMAAQLGTGCGEAWRDSPNHISGRRARAHFVEEEAAQLRH